jgi:hypothetical protein
VSAVREAIHKWAVTLPAGHLEMAETIRGRLLQGETWNEIFNNYRGGTMNMFDKNHMAKLEAQLEAMSKLSKAGEPLDNGQTTTGGFTDTARHVNETDDNTEAAIDNDAKGELQAAQLFNNGRDAVLLDISLIQFIGNIEDTYGASMPHMFNIGFENGTTQTITMSDAFTCEELHNDIIEAVLQWHKASDEANKQALEEMQKLQERTYALADKHEAEYQAQLAQLDLCDMGTDVLHHKRTHKHKDEGAWPMTVPAPEPVSASASAVSVHVTEATTPEEMARQISGEVKNQTLARDKNPGLLKKRSLACVATSRIHNILDAFFVNI